jgi:hypothetical protein
LNDSVLDVMRRTHLYEKIGEDHLFRNVAKALEKIHEPAHRNSQEKECPLLTIRFKGLTVSPAQHKHPEGEKSKPTH